MKRSKSAVSTMLLAAIVVLILAVAAVGIYFFVLSEDGEEDWLKLDFSDPMIEGTLGVGTVYTYDYTVDGADAGEVTMTIIGQSGSYYAVAMAGSGISYGEYGMIHKKTGQLRFSESQGTEGTYDGEPLTKWKLNMAEGSGVDKRGGTDVTVKMNEYFVFSSNSKSILPVNFSIHNYEEMGGQKTSKISEAKLTSEDRKPSAEYEMSKYIGNMAWYYTTEKEGNKVASQGNGYQRIVGDVDSNQYFVINIYDIEITSDDGSAKVRSLYYGVTSDNSLMPSPYQNYTKGDNVNIDTNWGKKDCEYYHYEYTSPSSTSKYEIYVGEDGKVTYLRKNTTTYTDGSTEYSEYVLKDYVLN